MRSNLPLAISRVTGRCSTCWREAVEHGRSSSSGPRLASRPCTSPQLCGTMAAATRSQAKVARARDNLTAGGLIDLVEIREGDAPQTLARDLPERIDLLLLDGAKALYPRS